MESTSLSSSRQAVNSSLNPSANASSWSFFAETETSPASASFVDSEAARGSFAAAIFEFTKACTSRIIAARSSVSSSGQSRHICENTVFRMIEFGQAAAAASAAFFASLNFFSTISGRVWSSASRWARRARAYRTSGCLGFASTSLSSSFVARARAPFLVKIS